MVRFDRIVCPVDTSDFSVRALQYAVALAQQYRSELTVLTVRPLALPPALWFEYPTASVLEPIDAASEEDNLRAFIREAVGPALAKVVVREGSITGEILESASDLRSDLIVMGTHGRSGVEHVLLGSVAENVLRRAPCPVLTVPRGALEPPDFPTPTFKNVLCAIDFSRDSSCALGYARSFAETAGGRLVLLHVIEQVGSVESTVTAHFNVSEFRRVLDRDARQRLEALIPTVGPAPCETSIVIGHGQASGEVLRVADAHEADLIVVGIHDRSAVDLALFGSTAQHVLHRAHTPVLAVPREMKAAAVAA